MSCLWTMWHGHLFHRCSSRLVRHLLLWQSKPWLNDPALGSNHTNPRSGETLGFLQRLASSHCMEGCHSKGLIQTFGRNLPVQQNASILLSRRDPQLAKENGQMLWVHTFAMWVNCIGIMSHLAIRLIQVPAQLTVVLVLQHLPDLRNTPLSLHGIRSCQVGIATARLPSIRISIFLARTGLGDQYTWVCLKNRSNSQCWSRVYHVSMFFHGVHINIISRPSIMSNQLT